MKWEKRAAEIEGLRRRFGRGDARRSPVPFPDLKCEQRTVACGNGFGDGRTPARVQPRGARQFPIGHLHTSGMQLITPGSDLKSFAGNKA